MSSEEYTAETETSVIDVEFANAANMTGTGIYYPLSTGKNHVMCKEFIPVIPGGAYTLKFTVPTFTVSTEREPNVYLHFYTERDEHEYVGVVNVYPYNYENYTIEFNVPSTAYYMRIVLYAQDEPVENLMPRDMLLYLTGTEPVLEGTRVISTKKLDVPGIHREMVAQGLIDGHATIPAYYNADGYLAGKVSRIKELYDACAGNGDAFVFVTDQHWTLNAGNSPAIIGHIMQEADIYRVFCGGDMAEGYNTNYIANMRSNVDRSIYWAMGNHEYNQRNGHELCRVLDGGKENQIGNPLRHYYYVDNRQQKIRYIFLSPFDRDIANSTVVSQYESEQIAWLTDDALKVETGWTVIVVTHCLYYGSASSAALAAWPDGASSVVSALEAADCDVACIIQGHLHLDRICHTPGGIPVVATTSDKYQPWVEGETNMEPWMSNRVEGTITEQAFDAVVLDKAQRKLTFVRIGAPADNWTDGASTGTVEERVVTY